MRSPRTATKSSPCSPQLEKAHAQQGRPDAAQKTNKQTKISPSVLSTGPRKVSLLFVPHLTTPPPLLLLLATFHWYSGSMVTCHGPSHSANTNAVPAIEKPPPCPLLPANFCPFLDLSFPWSSLDWADLTSPLTKVHGRWSKLLIQQHITSLSLDEMLHEG